jgi:RND family efflux transporter MFP subunit
MSKRSKIFGLGTLLLVLVVGVTFVVSQQGGKPSEAIASSDSTGVDSDTTAIDGEENGKDEKKEKPPVPVELAAATPRDIPSYFNATGSLEAKRQVKLISKASGQIVRLKVEEGDYVKEGQVILEIDHREEKLMVEQTEIKAKTAGHDLDRSAGLVEKGLGSDKDFELKKELAEVSALEHNLAKVRLDNKIVRAPYSGQITIRHIELGQTVNVGEPLVDIADVSPLEVRLYLPEKIVKTLKTGQPVEIRSDVAPDHRIDGMVHRIAPSVDPATSTVKVTLRVEDRGGVTRVGSFVRARITTDLVENAVSVPKKALVPEAGVTYVFVAEGDSVRKVTVTTGYADDDFIEITAGLTAGEKVVTIGQGGLRQGSKIKDLAAADGEDDGKGQADATDERQDYADAQDK